MQTKKVNKDKQNADAYMFSKRLQVVMYDKKISQADIVGKTGTNKSTMSLWFNGHVKPNSKSIRMLAEFIGCEYEWLSSGEGEMFGRDMSLIGKQAADYDADKENKLTSINESELIEQTKDVLRSNTVYRGALASNIKAFHKAVRGEKEMEDVISRMKMMQDQLNRMERKIDERVSPEASEKRKILNSSGQ